MAVISNRRPLVVDANILIRAVLGIRVFSLLENYGATVRFLTAEQAFIEASRRLTDILARRATGGVGVDSIGHEEELRRLGDRVDSMSHDVYADLEAEARRRLRGRDESDWPFLALALQFDCPIWTEDQDFFGTGIGTWTTDRVEIYLAQS